MYRLSVCAETVFLDLPLEERIRKIVGRYRGGSYWWYKSVRRNWYDLGNNYWRVDHRCLEQRP